MTCNAECDNRQQMAVTRLQQSQRPEARAWSFMAGNSARSAATAEGPTVYAWRSPGCERHPAAAKELFLSRRALAAVPSWASSPSLLWSPPKPRFALACQAGAISDMAAASAGRAAGRAGPP